MNIDENLIESLITNKTKAIFTVDYAGIPCEMDVINQIAQKYKLFVIEDAAQAVGSYYNEKPAGTLSEFGCYSFHETKNYTMGEGGALVVNKKKYMDRAEIIREKGTNRKQMLQGLVDKYSWHDVGSSFLPSDILAAILYAQMERFDEITEKHMIIWETYHNLLIPLEQKEQLRRPILPSNIIHNAHMYNVILPSEKMRNNLINYLREKDILAYICYVPLHSSPMGRSMGFKIETCPITEECGKRVLRLPLHPNMTMDDVHYVVEQIQTFFTKVL